MNESEHGFDLFFSHNRRQKPWVRQVVTLLRSKGLRVFFDEDSINPGEDIVSALERAVESSKTLVLVLSRSSVFSKWVAFETAMRIYEDPEGSLLKLIPILIEPVDRTLIRPAIRRLDYVDLTDPTTRESEFLHFLQYVGVSDVTASQLPPWPEPSEIEELHIADLTNVTHWKWTGEQLLERLIRLDYEILENLTAEDEGHPRQWSPVFLDHPETWRLLVTPSREVVGYWHFVPLFEEEFQRALLGELKDSQITSDRVRLFELPGTYPMYFISFGLLPRFRRTKGYKLLLDSLFEVMTRLAKDGIYVDRVGANAYTPSGESLCKSFGMTLRQKHSSHGNVYYSTMAEILKSDICSGYAELRALYSNRPPASFDVGKSRSAVM